MRRTISQRSTRFVLLAALSAAGVLAFARNAPAEATSPGAAPVPTGAPPVQPITTLVKPVSIIKVASQGPVIAYTMRNATSNDAPVDFNRNDSTLFGAPTHLTIKAHGDLVDTYDADLGPLCQRSSVRYVKIAGGATVDDRVRKATRVSQVFKTDILVGGVGAPPAQSEIDREMRIVSAVVVNPYACGQKFAVRAHLKNGSSVTPQHLSLTLHAMPAVGAGIGPKIASRPIELRVGAEGDFVVETEGTVDGRAGWVTLLLEDTTNELGPRLGYYKSADITVTDISSGDWKLE
jgi:hypothetical protein